MSIASCLRTMWFFLLRPGVLTWLLLEVLQTNDVTATGDTRDWWLMDEADVDGELLSINKPPPPWIWERLKTRGGLP